LDELMDLASNVSHLLILKECQTYSSTRSYSSVNKYPWHSYH
jgi:hypothetical protein